MKITLCGSTKFMEDFNRVNIALTLKGHIVYSVATTVHGELEVDEDEKDLLDLVHLTKILESDAIVVLNRDDYIGYSTNREVVWARMHNKELYYMHGSDFIDYPHHLNELLTADSISMGHV